jgi:ribosomal protein L37AE/L43A
MVFLTKCPRCKSREVRLQEDMQGLYWKCPKCQHVVEALNPREGANEPASAAPGLGRRPS